MSDPTNPSGPANSIGDHPHDDLAVYALDALDGSARQEVDAHLARCAACRAELAEHHEALAALTPDVVSPPSVWQRIAADVGAPAPAGPAVATPDGDPPALNAAASASAGPIEGTEGSGPGEPAVPFRPQAGEASGRRRPAHAADRTHSWRARSRWVGAGAALVSAAAAVAAFSVITSGSDGGADNLTELAQRAEETGDMLGDLVDPDGRPVARVVSDGGASFVMLEGLQPLPAGRTYQLWSLDGPQPVSLALLGDGRTDVLAVPLPATVATLAISDEPDPGVASPTGPIVATGNLTRS